ncbi:hypothetical protein [Burkholderia thailandensis]|uniref:Hydrogenase maturation factor n=1 Tax=Burkholderia thailandensis TaxID=57975 RepID=A0AAW9CNT3_BURTH|nr:hypothetical protein [Burkholderia thailandensis]UCR75695.1 hypothetical protein BtTXDOH_46 [Burkholderia phage phiBt-TXDOH]AIP65178.1 hypothetical protein DR62_4524 [Burkholderia thailandensis]AOI56069.1 hypothetical protein WI24_27740 [Burkholderia thailandensis]MCS3393151.1 hypothetical protein [Burkholderia thailandensis]MCS6426275.1 hypothetical protein [Burkholderia thailandensis]
MLKRFTYRGYDVEIEATEREGDTLGPRVLVGMSIVRTRDGEVLFLEAPIRMLPAGKTITRELAIEYRRDEARRRIDNSLS